MKPATHAQITLLRKKVLNHMVTKDATEFNVLRDISVFPEHWQAKGIG